MLKTWHCPHSIASSPLISPALWAHNSKPAATGLLLWTHAGTDERTDAVPFHRPAAPHTMRAVPLACRQSGWIATRIKMTARRLLPKTVVNTFGSLSFELINLKLCKTRRHSLERVLPSRRTEIGNVVTITEQIHRHVQYYG